MASSLGVEEVSTTSGIGPYVLAGPTPDHWRFADKIGNTGTVTYAASDGARSEYGVGRFEYPATLYRQHIINSSAGNLPIDWPVSGQTIISLISDPGAGIPPGGDCAQALIKLSAADFDASWQWRPYPIAVWIDGAAGANRQVRLAITEAVLFFSGFVGSAAYADTPPSIDVVIAINRIAPDGLVSTFGWLTFATGATIGSWSTSGQQLYPGDRIEFLFPALVGSIGDLSFTARGIIICSHDLAIAQPALEASVFEGGGYGTGIGVLEFGLPTSPSTADTILIACWVGYVEIEPGSNFVLLFANGGATNIGITIGDGVGDVALGHFGIFFYVLDHTGVESVSGYVDIPVDLTDGWHSLAISLQGSTQTLQVMVDRVVYPVTPTIQWYSSLEFGYSGELTGQWQLGGPYAGGVGSNTPPAFVYTDPLHYTMTGFAPNVAFFQFRMGFGEDFFDLTDSVNADKLFTADNKYVDWGPNGELVTGDSPPANFMLFATSMEVNTGTSGIIDPPPPNWTMGGPANLDIYLFLTGTAPTPPGYGE